MKLKLTVTLYILTISSLILFNSGCNGVKSGEASFGSLNVPPPVPPTPPVPPSAPDGSTNGIENDDQYFYVGIKNDENDAIVHVHDATSFSKKCSVPKTSLAHEDITCLIDIPEGDVYNKNLEIQYNAPKQMCRYLSRTPYWFYNREVGTGPTVVAVSADNSYNASGDYTGSTFTCAIDGNVLPCSGAGSHPEVQITGLSSTSQSIKCVYDYDGTNCCLGKYTFTRTNLTNGANPSVSAPTETDWGGKLQQCLGGPGKTNWDVFNTEGYPNNKVEYSWLGTKGVSTVTAPSELTNPLGSDTSSIHMSNYFGSAANHTHTGFVSILSSTRPYFVTPIDDRDGTPVKSGNDNYTFICYDEAYEIKHRIRVYVREWDYYPDYAAFISSLGLTFQPDKSSYLDPGPDETDPTCVEGIAGLCNDFGDIDDFFNLYVAADAPLATPAYDMTDVTKRRAYFPFIKY